MRTGIETARFELDGAVTAIAALAHGRIAAGDRVGRLHWLEIWNYASS